MPWNTGCENAFFMVDQPSPMFVTLLGQIYAVIFLDRGLALEAGIGIRASMVQRAALLSQKCAVLHHVDDTLFCGDRDYWRKTFLAKFSAKFKVSHSEIPYVDVEIYFLKKKIRRLSNDLAFLPGTSAEKVIKLFEDQFRKVRNQSIPCDSGIHTEDLSAEFPCDQFFACRSVVGNLLVFCQRQAWLVHGERTVRVNGETHSYSIAKGERAGWICVSTPKNCVLLDVPIGGQGRWRFSLSGCENELHAMIRTLSDGIFLWRCLEFVFNTKVENVMFTGPSSGRQLAMRQGTGKIEALIRKGALD